MGAKPKGETKAEVTEIRGFLGRSAQSEWGARGGDPCEAGWLEDTGRRWIPPQRSRRTPSFPQGGHCAPQGPLVSLLTHGSGGSRCRFKPWPRYFLAGLFYFCTSVFPSVKWEKG